MNMGPEDSRPQPRRSQPMTGAGNASEMHKLGVPRSFNGVLTEFGSSRVIER